MDLLIVSKNDTVFFCVIFLVVLDLYIAYKFCQIKNEERSVLYIKTIKYVIQDKKKWEEQTEETKMQ